MIKVIIEPINGEPKGLAFEKDEITFGRAPDNDVILSSARASRHHAKVFVENNIVYVEDLNSSNGIVLNGDFVKKSEINSNDIMMMGSVKIAVRYDDDSEQRASQLNIAEQSKGNIFDTISVSKPEIEIPEEPANPFDETQKLPAIDKEEE